MRGCVECGSEAVTVVDNEPLCADCYVDLGDGVDPLDSCLNEDLRLLSNHDLEGLGIDRSEENTKEILWKIREKHPSLEDRWTDVFQRFLDL